MLSMRSLPRYFILVIGWVNLPVFLTLLSIHFLGTYYSSALLPGISTYFANISFEYLMSRTTT